MMASLVTIRMNEELRKSMQTNANRLHLSQTDYIRKAIEQMNNQIEKKERKERLQNASLMVRKNSMEINAEFSAIEYDPETE